MTDATTAGAPPRPPLAIVLLCAPARAGGLERVVQSLARGLAARGHAVTVVAVVASVAEAAPFFEPFAGSRVTVRPLELGGRAYRRERREVRAVLREARADVLHTHGYRSDLLHGAPARRAGVATVSTVHGSSRMGGLSHLFEWLQLRALRGFDAVIPVSAPLERALRAVGVAPARLHRVPNAVAPRSEPLARAAARAALGIADDGTPELAWVGRLVEVKGADVLVDALARLAGARWRATLVGDGPAREATRERIARHGLGDRVRLLGEVDDAARLLAAFDAFVLSSRSEGTPIAVLEAMQAGLPVVSTAVGGVPDLLGEGNGWLVPSEDPAALAAAIGEAIADPAEARRRAARARARIDAEYDPARWIARHEAVYDAAIAVARARRGGR